MEHLMRVCRDLGFKEETAGGECVQCGLTLELSGFHWWRRLALDGTMYWLAREGPSGAAGGCPLERGVGVIWVRSKTPIHFSACAKLAI